MRWRCTIPTAHREPCAETASDAMQDLEGDRLNGFTVAGIDRTAFPLDDTKGYTADAGTVLLSWDAEARKALYATEIEYNRPVSSREMLTIEENQMK